MQRKNRGLLVYGLILMFLLSIISPALAVPTNSQPESVSQTTSVFKDVTDQDLNLAFINYLSSKGIIKGFTDGTFHPSESLTRAQAATIAVLAGGAKIEPTQPNPFRDVQTDHWARANIAAAAEAGYISGFPDKSFRPEEKLSRAQAASLILRLSKQSLSGAVLPQLSDMNSDHWAAHAVAAGITSGMLGLSANGQQVYPEQAMSRGELARALGVLLTKDPDLSQATLVGQLTVKSGTVTIQSGSQEAKIVNGSTVIAAGDTINTDKNAEADITYGDGSGLLLKDNSQLIVKEARGRSYIKPDGSAGIAVDWLRLDLKKGQLFGALPTSSQLPESPSSTARKTTSFLGTKKLLASLSNRNSIAAAQTSDEAMPWYEAAKTKKVKVKVDMPWGIAAIRGTFWNNSINSNGSGSTSILTGSGEVTAGGQTVTLGAMQATLGTSANIPPSPVQTMTAAQMSAWTQVAAWAEQRAAAIQQNQEVSPQAPPVNAQVQAAPPVVSTIVQTISSALTAAKSIADNVVSTNASSSSDSGGSPSTTDTTPIVTPGSTTAPLGANLGSYTLTDRVTVAGSVYAQSDAVLTQDFTISPSADLAARTTRFKLLFKLAAGEYITIANKLLNEPIRHLKKIFNPEKLYVAFHNDDDDYNPVAIAALTSGNSLTNLATRTISGTISLPIGTVAPAGGINIIVFANGPYIAGSYNQIIQPITIPAGSNAVSYSLMVAPNDANNVSNNYPTSGSGGGSSIYPASIPLPGGVAAIPSASGASSGDVYSSPAISIPVAAGGGSSGTTTITASDVISNVIANTSYYSTGYAVGYKVIGTYAEPYVMTGSYASAVDVSSADKPNCDMAIQLGQVISGTIALPGGATAAIDLNVSIKAIPAGTGNYYSTYSRILTGTESADYSIVVPCGASYKLKYSAFSSSNNQYLLDNRYLENGYYSITGATALSSAATLVEVPTGTNVPNINLTIATGNKISGTVTLANNALAPSGGSYCYVYAYQPNTGGNSYGIDITIPENQNSVSYMLVVPPATYDIHVSGENSHTYVTGVDAGSGDATAHLILTPNTGYTLYQTPATIVHDWVYNGSVLVGNTVFALDSPGFTEENVASRLCSYDDAPIYYKTDAGNWFELQNSAANDVSYFTETNQLSTNALPSIYSAYLTESSSPAPWIQCSPQIDTYVVPQGFSGSSNFTLTPAETALTITNHSNEEIASLDLLPPSTSGPAGQWQGYISAGNAIGTNEITVRATAPDYPSVEQKITIKVVPGLTAEPTAVSSYSSSNISLTGAEGLWPAGTDLGIAMFNQYFSNYSSYVSNISTGADTISFTLASVYTPGIYTLYVIKDGVAIAASTIVVEGAY